MVDIESRRKDVLKSINSFSKKEYFKEELYDEFVNLEKEIVYLTFNKEHADYSDLRIKDVVNHFSGLKDRYEPYLKDKFEKFYNLSKSIIGRMNSLRSGFIGERNVIKSLDRLKYDNIVLINKEFCFKKHNNEHTTEIDAIVITKKGLFILEVKNSKDNIKLDRIGNFYKNDTLIYDSNILESLDDKEFILNSLLLSTKFKNLNIEKMVVCANNNIKFENDNEDIKYCYRSELTKKIEGYEGEEILTNKEMRELAKIIEQSETKKSYPIENEINEFKLAFVELLIHYDLYGGSEIIEEHTQILKESKILIEEQEKTNKSIRNNNWLQYLILGCGSALTGFFVGRLLKRN